VGDAGPVGLRVRRSRRAASPEGSPVPSGDGFRRIADRRTGRPGKGPAPSRGSVPRVSSSPVSLDRSSPGLPIRMLHDRVLVTTEDDAGERRSTAGIVIPATAEVGKRLAWARVVAVGQHVRQVQNGDRVLYDPADQAEVEIQGAGYLLLRERDIHAVAAPRVEDGQTGLYL
jgi:chaperonin GroES